MEEKDDNLVLKLGTGIPVLVFVAFLAYWFGLRDSWEVDNFSKIVDKAEAVNRAIAKSDDEEAARAYREFIEFIGDREIKETFMLERVAAVRKAFVPVEQRLKQAELAAIAETEQKQKMKQNTDWERLARSQQEYIAKLPKRAAKSPKVET